MPRQLLLSRIPVDLSVIEFDLDEEELFLSYTWDRRFGPGITRDGIGPPKMDSPHPGGPPAPITNPVALRMGTWLLRADLVDAEIAEATAELARLRENPSLAIEADTVARTIDELRVWKAGAGVHAHDTAFAQRYPQYSIVAQQGCGDLTMNAWCVAYVNNALAESRAELVRLHSERVEHRTYSCLVKWKPSESGVRRMTIEDVAFWEAGPEATVKGFQRDQWLPRGSRIDFAVSSQQVIREGAIVPVVTTCRQFGDLRHLLQLPNINPRERISPLEQQRPDGTYRPRPYKGTQAGNDIWLAEEQLLPKDGRAENLLRTALNGPVILPFPPDRDETSVRGALTVASYREVFSDLEPLRPGEWRFVKRDTAELLLEIFIRRNTYGLTMIGLSADARKLLWLACTGFPAKLVGYTIEDAARILLDAGAWNALLVDEGFDAMQEVRWKGSSDFEPMIPRKRNRVRAAFLVGRHNGR